MADRVRAVNVNDTRSAVAISATHVAAGRAEDIVSFSQTCCTSCTMVVGKAQTSHAAAGEIHRYWKQTACLHAHRVRPVNDMTYVVVDPTRDFASGKAEESIFFHKTYAHNAHVL
jgi:hypothetical protein